MLSQNIKDELETLLHKEIPLSQEMGVEILSLDPMQLELRLPLEPNKNHKNTLFGGSLYSACALACYGLFLTALRAENINTNNIVIGEGEIQYKAPVTKDTLVTASWPSPLEKVDFFTQLSKKGKARINMKALIEEDGVTACTFTGRFVAFL
jgi:thioesterase domain-containing protein